MKKIISLIAIFFIMSIGLLFSYETVKTIKITDNPNNYKDKNVLVYVKFGKIIDEDRINRVGFLEDFNIKGISYKYDLTNSELVKQIKRLKQRDLITVKGKVVLDGFSPVVEIHELVNGWIDTTLLPPTPDEIEVVCPKCGHTFKYKINKNDYKNSIISKRNPDITPIVEQKNTNNYEQPKSLTQMNPEEVKNRLNEDKIQLEETNKKNTQLLDENQKKDKNSENWSF